MSLRPLALALACSAALAPAAFGQKRELIQLQRDMALLQDALRQMEEKSSDRLVGLEALLRQLAEQQDKLSAGQAVIERSVAALDDALTEPQRVTGAKVDSLTEQFSDLRATVEEVGVVTDRIQADVRDVKTHLTTLPVPMGGEEGAEGGEAGMNASEAIFEGGLSDYLRGNIEIARGQFMDILALYPTHAKAGDAQYYLAETYYSVADYEEAARQFEQVYKRYPLNPMAPDSLYKLGMALSKLRGRDEDAIKAFESVLERFPDSKVAPLARPELHSLRNKKPSPGL